MVSLNLKWAVLHVLAKSPDRRVTFGEIRREVGDILETGTPIGQPERFFGSDDIDIHKAGLVLLDDVGLQITAAGLSLLRSIESSSGPTPSAPSDPASRSFTLIDSLIGAEDRLKIFDLELKTLEPAADECGFQEFEQWGANR